MGEEDGEHRRTPGRDYITSNSFGKDALPHDDTTEGHLFSGPSGLYLGTPTLLKAPPTAVPAEAMGASSAETAELKEMMKHMMFKMRTMEADLKEAKEAATSSKTRKTCAVNSFEKVETIGEQISQAPFEGQ